MDERKYFVYQHINKINNKKYIGITSRTPKERWGSNGYNYRSTPYFYSAIKKYGWDNFEHEILYSQLTKEEACEIERKLIEENKTQNKQFGYNITEGGDAPSMPIEIRKRLSEALKGNKNGLGKVCSEEKKRKISEAQKGKKLTEEHRKKLSLAKKGKSHKPLSIESRKKISDAHKKKAVYCEELDEQFESIHDCARKLNLSATAICAVCRGRCKSVAGFHIKYVESDNI